MDRLYSDNKLISWHQRRCCKCQRFLSIKQRNYCAKCGSQINKENVRHLLREGRNIYHQYTIQTIIDIIKIPLPQPIRLKLRYYF